MSLWVKINDVLLNLTFAAQCLWFTANLFGSPQSIQPSETCDMEHAIIQHTLPHWEMKDSGTECLNLNITVPKGQSSGLPVLVFIHGGGYFMGAGSWPQFDMQRIVALSIQSGKPIIGVTIK